MNFLNDVKVIELFGVAPVPFCGQILADFGADVTTISKQSSSFNANFLRNKKIITLDYKSELETIKDMISQADVLLDPYRPGTLEVMGLDPIELMSRNPRLIICRISSYGQTGSMSQKAGHDLNCIALSGILPVVTIANNKGNPWPPANILADFAAGSLTGAFGIVAALHERERTGNGGIVDVSMTDALMYLSSFIFAHMKDKVLWNEDYGVFRGNYPMYRVYKTKDDKMIAVGALEPKYQIEILRVLNINPKHLTSFKTLLPLMETAFKTKTRDQWTAIFDDLDACVTPVLELDEAKEYHLQKQLENFNLHELTNQPDNDQQSDDQQTYENVLHDHSGRHSENVEAVSFKDNQEGSGEEDTLQHGKMVNILQEDHQGDEHGSTSTSYYETKRPLSELLDDLSYLGTVLRDFPESDILSKHSQVTVDLPQHDSSASIYPHSQIYTGEIDSHGEPVTIIEQLRQSVHYKPSNSEDIPSITGSGLPSELSSVYANPQSEMAKPFVEQIFGQTAVSNLFGSALESGTVETGDNAASLGSLGEIAKKIEKLPEKILANFGITSAPETVEVPNAFRSTQHGLNGRSKPTVPENVIPTVPENVNGQLISPNINSQVNENVDSSSIDGFGTTSAMPVTTELPSYGQYGQWGINRYGQREWYSLRPQERYVSVDVNQQGQYGTLGTQNSQYGQQGQYGTFGTQNGQYGTLGVQNGQFGQQGQYGTLGSQNGPYGTLGTQNGQYGTLGSQNGQYGQQGQTDIIDGQKYGILGQYRPDPTQSNRYHGRHGEIEREQVYPYNQVAQGKYGGNAQVYGGQSASYQINGQYGSPLYPYTNQAINGQNAGLGSTGFYNQDYVPSGISRQMGFTDGLA
ncbi:unnamed protein product [Bursaphelenchus okinawaensis]|uniref:Uncharacterized protein n=1 Tax=Bursaphelenchus okinawaensis TaxID=465554 RepID=A0A811KYF4_9BILA|nr:unnamed protein product [Bursaphelenchus okinawaensis]CAG9114228.1 unnamed protein product [Bursaphelenchus okinawaensis]